MEKIMPYCRISVERYIFDRIQPAIVPIYSHKTAEENAIFEEKRARIFSQKRLREIFAEINLEQYNWLFELGAEDKLECVVTVQEARKSLKYRRACE
jgi:L-amino acid N-acyltransferase YncA